MMNISGLEHSDIVLIEVTLFYSSFVIFGGLPICPPSVGLLFVSFIFFF